MKNIRERGFAQEKLDSLQYELEAGNQSSKRKMKIKTMGIY
jgi:hypothetical protein